MDSLNPEVILLIEHMLTAFGKVNEFFKDEEKSTLWMNARNPLLGHTRPVDMILSGRHEKLFDMIDSCLRSEYP